MPDLWVNGASSPWRNSGWTDKNLRSTGAMPTGRLAASGRRPIRFTRVRQWVSGNGASRSVKLYVYGALTGAFTVAKDTSAALSSWRNIDAAVADTATTPNFGFGFDTNGSVYFGRTEQSGRTITGDSGFEGCYINGQVTYIQVPTAPGTPTVDLSGLTATITWAAPSDDGGSAITDYWLEWADNSAFNNATLVGTGKARSYTTTLTGGKTYYFRVRAENNAPAGETSVNSGTRSVTTPSAPATPAAPTVTVAATTAAVSWSAPNNGGSAITAYELQRSAKSDFSSPTTASTTSTFLDVTGLTRGSTYYYRVRAKNAAGWSSWSSARSATQWDVPSAPSSLSVTPGPTSAGLSWSAPSNGGTTITGYEVQYATNSSFSGATTVTVTGSSTTIQGLTPGATYYYRVRAKNAAGVGNWSATASGRQLAGGSIRKNGQWTPATWYVRRNGQWVMLTPQIRAGNQWKALL